MGSGPDNIEYIIERESNEVKDCCLPSLSGIVRETCVVSFTDQVKVAHKRSSTDRGVTSQL